MNIDYVNLFLKNTEGPVRKSMFFNDGTHLSVQASKYHHCEPKADHGPYRTVEVYHWPDDENFFEDYSVEDSPASYVPVPIVNFYIMKRGGLFEEF